MTSQNSILPPTTPESAGLDPDRLDTLNALIESHIAGGRYPGAQIAIARDGKLVRAVSFGDARIGGDSGDAVPANERTLWLMFSQTKVVVTATLWQLVESGALRFTDKISDHVPEFAANGKGDITLFEVITHQGGFPSAEVPPEAWEDHDLLRAVVSDFSLEWTPGSKVSYHGLSAHWVAAVVMEAVTGRDYRDHIRESLLAPLGLDDEIFVGVGDNSDDRCADLHVVEDDEMRRSERKQQPRLPSGGNPRRRRIRHGDGHGKPCTR